MADAAETNEEAKVEVSMDYVLVRHCGRSSKGRSQRAVHRGLRKRILFLADGTRLRRQGNGRYTKMSYEALLANADRMFKWLVTGRVQVKKPGQIRHLNRDDLAGLLSELKYTGVLTAPKGDVTRPDMGQGAVMAAVDQHEAEMTGEANEPQDEEEVLTEADLKKMSRGDLDDLAKDQGLNPDEFSNKGALIDALLGEE